MKVNGLMITVMDMVYKYGLMDQNMRATGLITKHLVKENFTILMEIFMMDNGKIINVMDLEYL